MGPKINIEGLLEEFDREVGTDPGVDAAVILFPYFRELKDGEVHDFYTALHQKRGYQGKVFDTVEEVKHFAETYRIIGSCVAEEFISF